MSAGELSLLLGLLANACAIVCVGVFGWLSNRKIVANIEVVHRATNSMKDELVTEVREASLAKGIKAGRAQRNAKRQSLKSAKRKSQR